MRALAEVVRTPWAMTEEALWTVLEVTGREKPREEVDAVLRELGERVEGTRGVTVRDGVAVVPVIGPIVRRGNLFTDVSGMTSIQTLALDLGRVLEDPQIRAILLEIDSPGGAVNGTSEIAEMVFRARGVKPVWAHIGGSGASGAYWIASGANEIAAADTAMVGNIGVRMTLVDTSEAEEKRGIRVIDIVSSQTPKKVVDPTEAEGRVELQRVVDELAEVFIGAVARNRAVSPQVVVDEFATRPVFVGQSARRVGLVDRIETLEDTLARLRERADESQARIFGPGATANSDVQEEEEEEMPEQNKQDTGQQRASAPEITVAYLREHHADVVAAIRDEAATEAKAAARLEERKRIRAIQDLAEPGQTELVHRLIDEGGMAEAAAVELLKDVKRRRADRAEQMRADDKAAEGVQASTGAEGTEAKAPGSAWERAEAKARELVRQNDLTFEAALEKVFAGDRDLQREYLKEVT